MPSKAQSQSVDPARQAAVLGDAMRNARIMSLAHELDATNRARDTCANVMSSQLWEHIFTPARQAEHLMGIAQIDRKRRQLRQLLFDELGA
jgi:hypothetical protein